MEHVDELMARLVVASSQDAAVNEALEVQMVKYGISICVTGIDDQGDFFRKPIGPKEFVSVTYLAPGRESSAHRKNIAQWKRERKGRQ